MKRSFGSSVSDLQKKKNLSVSFLGGYLSVSFLGKKNPSSVDRSCDRFKLLKEHKKGTSALNLLKEEQQQILSTRNLLHVGETGKPLKDVVAVGIGGSFFGPLFVHSALQTDPEAITSAKGRQLRFLLSLSQH